MMQSMDWTPRKTWSRFVLVLGLMVLSFLQESEAGWKPRILSEGQPYLPDFSYAGYSQFEMGELAVMPRELKAGDFGVIPDDGLDDSAALGRLFEKGAGAIIYLPAGRIILKEILLVPGPRTTIKGAGSGKTIIEIPIPLARLQGPEVERIRKAGENHAPTSPYSWTGGFITARPLGDYWKGSKVVAVSGKRGEFKVILAEKRPWTQSQAVQIRWFNKEGKTGSLLSHVYGVPSLDIGEQFTENPGSPMVRQYAAVRRVRGSEMELFEPLLHDIKPEWSVEVTPIAPMERITLAGFTLEFPYADYPGHHKEEGYNGIYLDQVRQAQISDVTIINSDSGLILDACHQSTVEGITILGRGGHYSAKIGGGTGVLVKNFRFGAPSLHNPSFNTQACGSVYSHGLIENARLDQHNGANHQNLFDDIEIRGDPKGLFHHGGSRSYRPTAAAFNTFWNLRIISGSSTTDLRPDALRDAPLARLVGLTGDRPIVLDYGPEAYVEGLNEPGIAVPSLYERQKKAQY